MRKMKTELKNEIIVFHPLNGFGGSQWMTSELIEVLSTHKNISKTKLYIGFGSKGFLKSRHILCKIENRFLRVLLLPYISLIFAIKTFFLRNKIIGVTTYSIYSLFFKALIFPKTVLFYFHEIPSSQVTLYLMKLLSIRRVQLIFVSNYHKNQCQIKGKVIYNFIKTDNIVQTKPPSKTLIFIGSASLKKGFDRFIDLCSRFEVEDEFEFIAYLNSIDRILVEKAKNLGVQINIGVTSKEIMFEKKGLLIQPSRAKETFSLVALEAATWGIPILHYGQEVLKELLPKELLLSYNSDRSKLDIMNLLNNTQHYKEISQKLRESAIHYTINEYERNIEKYIIQGFINRN